MNDSDINSGIEDASTDVEAESDTAASMASAMGFTSFGSQPASKRRKYNDPPGQTSSSGANSAPLGTRSVGQVAEPAAGSGMNRDYADPVMKDGARDASLPARPGPTSPANAELSGATTPANVTLPARPPVALPQPYDHAEHRGGSFFPHQHRGGQAQGRGRGRGRGGFRGEHGGGGGGRGNALWYEDYSDPSFVINPWEKLEKQYGLKPRDVWPSWEEAKAGVERVRKGASLNEVEGPEMEQVVEQAEIEVATS